ncbi:hypothetical protein GCM10022397_30710 [Flavivirga jejuensis]
MMRVDLNFVQTITGVMLVIFAGLTFYMLFIKRKKCEKCGKRENKKSIRK